MSPRWSEPRPVDDPALPAAAYLRQVEDWRVAAGAPAREDVVAATYVGEEVAAYAAPPEEPDTPIRSAPIRKAPDPGAPG